MPRLTNQSYLQQRTHLRECWLERQGLFGNLSPSQQWDLHAYFKLSENLTDDAAIAHRVHLTKARPSMPHRAGKAYQQFVEAERAPAPVRVGSRSRKSDHIIQVKSVVRPEPDYAKLVRVLVDMWKTEKERLSKGPDA